MSFSKKLFIVWLVLFILCMIWSQTKANAEDTQPCVTKSEYAKVVDYHNGKLGWTRSHVKNVFDTNGVALDKYTREYPTCNAGLVHIFFMPFENHYRVVTKSNTVGWTN